MEKKQQTPSSKAIRKGDTSRSSSQGRKLSSGKDVSAKGSAEMDEATHSPKSAKKKPREPRP